MMNDALRQRLRDARHVAVFTGAGMSAESGIPTFRDRLDGLWTKVDPLEVATPQAFARDPQGVWNWHALAAEVVAEAQPNAGHRALAQLEGRVPKLTVVTQNIDGLHQAAGNRHVLELHGNLFRLKGFVDPDHPPSPADLPVPCRLCRGYATWLAGDPLASAEDFAAIELVPGPVPRCPACQSLLRPDVVWFNEMLDADLLDAAMDAMDGCDVLLSIGASLEVEPAASLPWRALRRGALTIEINPQPTPLADQADLWLAGTAVQMLPPLLAEVWGLIPS